MFTMHIAYLLFKFVKFVVDFQDSTFIFEVMCLKLQGSFTLIH